jgi:hypothetical protein
VKAPFGVNSQKGGGPVGGLEKEWLDLEERCRSSCNDAELGGPELLLRGGDGVRSFAAAAAEELTLYSKASMERRA